jgi:hypothetical protein
VVIWMMASRPTIRHSAFGIGHQYRPAAALRRVGAARRAGHGLLAERVTVTTSARVRSPMPPARSHEPTNGGEASRRQAVAASPGFPRMFDTKPSAMPARAKLGQKFRSPISAPQTERPRLQGLSSSGGRI